MTHPTQTDRTTEAAMRGDQPTASDQQLRLSQDSAIRLQHTVDALRDENERLRNVAIIGWIYEDELPASYPYDVMYPFSKVNGVRMFPVFAPTTATKVEA